MGINHLQKALDNRPTFPLAVKYEGSLEQWFADFEEKFATYRASLELPVGGWLTKKAKTSKEVLEWCMWGKSPLTYEQRLQRKWGSVDEIQPRLMKLMQERDDNKLLVIQAVTKLRAKEEQLEGKVLVDRKQFSDSLDRLAEDCHDKIVDELKFPAHHRHSGWAKVLQPIIWGWYEKLIHDAEKGSGSDKS